ncbi:MAG: ATP-binding protein [Sciscionella sp.]
MITEDQKAESERLWVKHEAQERERKAERERQAHDEWLDGIRRTVPYVHRVHGVWDIPDEGDDDQLHAGTCGWLAAMSGWDGYHGPSVMFSGTVGTGKSWQALRAVRHLVAASGRRFDFAVISETELTNALRPGRSAANGDALGRYLKSQLLLVDDLGSARPSGWTEAEMFRLIDGRYRDGKPTLFTTNLPPKDLARPLGERTTSRLAEMCHGHVVVPTGPDRRRRS